MQATTPPKDEGLDGLGLFSDDPNKLKKLINEFKAAIGNLSAGATEINATFGQTRQRIVEIQTAIADAAPGITRLGGNIGETIDAINKAAEGSRRNVIITTEQTEKLYAASKRTGQSVKGLVDGFAEVGVGVDALPKQLEKSFDYIRSIGGNSKQIFESVNSNMEQLNRYQFQGGVEGLTKMAAQASMLRFDMSNTFALAEKVLSPEGAIETASAFQRLGVAAGNLVDPFQLMNLSINDPSGLQDSLANVSKQFTYFDEQTKTFKINPQGVLTLREMEKEANLAQGSLSKMGLAAAEADQRISAIKGVGLNLSEEDNQLLSNISRMGDGGEYEIKVKDPETQKEYYDKISNISQQQLEATLKEQKDGPKTLEDLQRAQLTTTDLIYADLNAIKDKVVFGAVSPRTLLEGVEGGRRLTTTATGEFSKSFKTEDVRNITQSVFTSVGELIKDVSSGKKDKKTSAADFFDKIQNLLNKTENSVVSGLKGTGASIAEKLTDKTSGEGYLKQLLTDFMSKYGQIDTYKGTDKVKNEQINSLMYGKDGAGKQLATTSAKGEATTMTTKSTVDVGGKIIVEFNTPNGTELTKKMFDDWANSPQTKQYFANLNSQQNPTKAPINTTYGN
jgi:uncharacterized protein YoxC